MSSLPHCNGCNKCRPGEEEIKNSAMIRAYVALLNRSVDMYSCLVAFSSSIGENEWSIFVLGHKDGQFMHGYFKHNMPLPTNSIYSNQDFPIRWYCGPTMEYIKNELTTGSVQNIL